MCIAMTTTLFLYTQIGIFYTCLIERVAINLCSNKLFTFYRLDQTALKNNKT